MLALTSSSRALTAGKSYETETKQVASLCLKTRKTAPRNIKTVKKNFKQGKFNDKFNFKIVNNFLLKKSFQSILLMFDGKAN